MAYRQCCWAHKTRDILDKVRKKDRDAMKDLQEYPCVQNFPAPKGFLNR